MANTNNKVKFGLKNVYYAVATIDEATNVATYATPVRWPGAVSLSMDAQGDTTSFYADDGTYFTGVVNNGYSGDLETALVPESFREDVLQEAVDTNGVHYDNTNATQVHFALLFEFQGDAKGKRHVLYNCVATRPTISSSTKAESIEVQTETVTITATQIHNDKLDKDMTKADVTADGAAYADWFKAVYLPGAAG